MWLNDCNKPKTVALLSHDTTQLWMCNTMLSRLSHVLGATEHRR
jgi:hypothetical protein